MTENKKQNIEIESKLYALTNTIINLSERYQKGDLKENFFQKSIKAVMNDLLKIHFRLREQNILLSEILEKTNLTIKYYQALDIINEVSSLNYASKLYQKGLNYSKTLSTSLLELPGITSNITSSFITLLDVMKLEFFEDIELLDKLFDELIVNIRKFPGLEKLEVQINKMHNYLLNNKNKFMKNKNFRSLIEDDLYKIYKEFQNKLNIQR